MYLVTPDPILVPKLLIKIVGKADCATNEYHTSAPGVPLHELDMVGLEDVAYANVPAVVVHVVLEDNVVAPEQASFEGGPGSVTQMLKFPVAPLLERTLI